MRNEHVYQGCGVFQRTFSYLWNLRWFKKGECLLKSWRRTSRTAWVLSWVGPENPGIPVDMGVEYNLPRRSSETPLANVGEEDMVYCKTLVQYSSYVRYVLVVKALDEYPDLYFDST